MTNDEERYRSALRSIVKWDFATDGRKFNGNHKEVLKSVMDIARLGLGIKELRKFLSEQKHLNK